MVCSAAWRLPHFLAGFIYHVGIPEWGLYNKSPLRKATGLVNLCAVCARRHLRREYVQVERLGFEGRRGARSGGTVGYVPKKNVSCVCVCVKCLQVW